MYTPKEFADKTGLSYPRVLAMCKNGEIEVANKSNRSGSHFNIPDKEVAKFIQPDGFISREQYETVIRENERLRTIIEQMRSYVLSLNS